MQPVRCALVGHGMIGREHAKILASNPMADLAVVCDTDPAAASGVPAETRFTADLDEALDTDGLEAVWVCTPQQVHLPVVEQGMIRGLHVFCEKPFASSLDDADRMMELDESTAGSLVIGHTLRFDPNYVAVHRAVDEGRLGEIVHASARWNAPDYEGRIISGRTTVPQEMAIHDLDVMRWMVGDIERVYAEAAQHGVVGPGPDAAVATVRFASGAVGALDHNWILPFDSGLRSDHRLAVFGTRGSAYVETRDSPAVVFSVDGLEHIHSGYYSYPNDVPYGALPSEDAFFLGRVRDGRAWPLTLGDARAALVAALAKDRSIEEGRPVDIVELDG
ncbi:MAG: Gfo/Idh/MocA family oxidoreductase [bacterium]|nr:Gfo/Idh/MocA family oxidoreductase [bacterium]